MQRAGVQVPIRLAGACGWPRVTPVAVLQVAHVGGHHAVLADAKVLTVVDRQEFVELVEAPNDVVPHGLEGQGLRLGSWIGDDDDAARSHGLAVPPRGHVGVAVQLCIRVAFLRQSVNKVLDRVRPAQNLQKGGRIEDH